MTSRDLTADMVIIKNRYEIVRKIGHGATGSVYIAHDSELSRPVAVKVLHQDLSNNEEISQRFEIETLVTSRLQHPGVVAVFDRATTVGGAQCYMMSLALGKTLAEYLDELRGMDDPWQASSLVDRINIFLKIIDVMTYAHGQGVVHRDLKPENIILGEHGEVRILDWGLARVLREPDDPFAQETHYDEVFGSGSQASASRSGSDRYNRRQPSDRYSKTDRVEDPAASGTALSALDETIINTALQAQGAVQHLVSAETADKPLLDVHAVDQLSATVISDASSSPPDHPAGADETRSSQTAQEEAGRDSDHGSRDDEGSPSSTTRSSHHSATSGEGTTHMTKGSAESSSQSATRRSSGRLRTASSHRDRRKSQVHSTGSERSTRLGAVLGSPAYMSPEQAAGQAGQADERTDIYSLGVILFELLTLRVPIMRLPGEAIVQYIKRVEDGDRQKLVDVWPESPKQLQVITEWALAKDAQERYASCEIFREELRILLVQFSENFAERERQRLANERTAAWLPIGSWNYLTNPQLDPFTEPVVAYEGEPVGQVVHPEMEGVLIGGVGVQIYPVSRELADDIHVKMEMSISRGQEAVIFLRGIPPHPCYTVSIGAFGGRWITVSRLDGGQGKQRPTLLTMQPLRMPINAAAMIRHQLDIQVIGSSIQVSFDAWTRIEVRDPCPLAGPMHRQMAIGSRGSQVVIHQLQIDQRRSPLMIAASMVGNELLRQQLIPQAIDVYRRFLQEHAGTDEATEAHFMLCLAFRQAGQHRQSERELEIFLSQSLDHPLAQDAIFELARLKVEVDHSVDRAVRTVLSYQETDDRSRSRFCLWMIDHFCGEIVKTGLSAEMERDIGLLQHLISVFEDSELLMDTLALALSRPIAEFGRRLMDEGQYNELDALNDAIQRCRLRGFDIQAPGLHPLSWYRPLVKRMHELPRNHGEFVLRVERLLGHATDLRDIILMLSLGARDPLLRWMEQLSDPEPTMLLLRGSVAKSLGREDLAQRDFMVCFQMMDVLETERNSTEATVSARLAFFALDYLPWEVVWQPIERMVGGDQYRALAALVAEHLSRPLESADAYRSLLKVGSGFMEFAHEGLARLGLEGLSEQ